ncbi:hypothetical protein K08M3_50090 [Vibrio alginolyticus]|jgi:hypothetical protein|uniref:Large polyvalent protein-associated domain-containing protein n=1 Tax=Vibrio alginolyticus TaxID=663 RepID=A0A1W6V9H5_VIBAL|nr:MULTISPECIES: hypothetical protein [Vibrio harveyi group]ARP06519.1 hypothetical protein K04M1_49960 [Vibrio alginolyticus]ARP11624.1 hypothetical protein K04M3_50550 [Vibrio alginolyticus]ARP16705.1 hypothetical protein K04M5_50530 [Vibrio alginolyticus]ARP21724.1 hypothetical protein K05K4_50150 [Vibrio alginolyticus]ARP26805.1 hypothetical protein K06K5_50050 [Vibrio alginolyticus]
MAPKLENQEVHEEDIGFEFNPDEFEDESLNDSELSPLAKEDSNQQFAPAMSDLLDMMKSPEAKSSNERELGVNAPTGLEVSNNPELTQTTSEIPSSDSTEQEQTASTVDAEQETTAIDADSRSTVANESSEDSVENGEPSQDDLDDKQSQKNKESKITFVEHGSNESMDETSSKDSDSESVTDPKKTEIQKDNEPEKLTGVKDDQSLFEQDTALYTNQPTQDVRSTVSEDCLSTNEDTNGIAPLNIDQAYIERYRGKRNIAKTVSIFENKQVSKLLLGNKVDYNIDHNNGKATFEIELFSGNPLKRQKDKIVATESDNHLEFEGDNPKEQASLMVKYAKEHGWKDLAVWGTKEFISEVKRQGVKHDINCLVVHSKRAALEVKVMPKVVDDIPLVTKLPSRIKPAKPLHSKSYNSEPTSPTSDQTSEQSAIKSKNAEQVNRVTADNKASLPIRSKTEASVNELKASDEPEIARKPLSQRFVNNGPSLG